MIQKMLDFILFFFEILRDEKLVKKRSFEEKRKIKLWRKVWAANRAEWRELWRKRLGMKKERGIACGKRYKEWERRWFWKQTRMTDEALGTQNFRVVTMWETFLWKIYYFKISLKENSIWISLWLISKYFCFLE